MATLLETDVFSKEITIGGKPVPVAKLPKQLKLNEELALVTTPKLSGQVLHLNRFGGLFEIRGCITPRGDYIMMFPDGQEGTACTWPQNAHYNNCYFAKDRKKFNKLLVSRSKDKGKTWSPLQEAFDIDYNQHGFIPLIPRGTKRIYAFGTQPIWGAYSVENGQMENAPIGYRYSDDDGYTWSDVEVIKPKEEPNFLGISVMQMCETDAGAWILSSSTTNQGLTPTHAWQYVLRSGDQGKSWNLLPGTRNNGKHERGWITPGHTVMGEGVPVSLSGGKVLMLLRTDEGHLWETRSADDGKSWSEPKPTVLEHPSAPPMLFKLSDRKTLAVFYHKRRENVDNVRSELWVTLSRDEGQTWSEAGLLLVSALAPDRGIGWYDYNCSYLDMFIDNGVVNMFLPHRWRRALHMQLPESELFKLPTLAQLL